MAAIAAAESKEVKISLSTIPDVPSRENLGGGGGDDESKEILPVLHDNDLQYAGKPDSGVLVMSSEVVAIIAKYSSTIAEEEKKAVTPAPVNTDEALTLMNQLVSIDSKRLVSQLNGVSHSIIPVGTYCRYCGTQGVYNQHHYRCNECQRQHCLDCHEAFQNGTFLDVYAEDDLKDGQHLRVFEDFKRCSEAHSANWERKETRYVAPLGLKFHGGQSQDYYVCDVCQEHIPKDQKQYFSLQANQDCCMTCAILPEGEALIAKYDLKLFDPAIHTTMSDIVELNNLTASTIETLEEEDGIGSLLNWVPVYKFAKNNFTVVQSSDDTLSDYLMVNCNPESKLYNMVAIAIGTNKYDDVQREDWYTFRFKTLHQVLTEMTKFSCPYQYLRRDAIASTRYDHVAATADVVEHEPTDTLALE